MDERRRTPRFTFIASTDILEDDSGKLIANTRVSDLSLSGCYVDALCPLVQGTPIRIRIFTDAHLFEAPATVVYSHLHMGMGLVFGEVQARFLDVLQNWLPNEAGANGELTA